MKNSKSSGADRRVPTRFSLPYLPAKQVGLAGTFNNWEPTPLELADPEGSRWEVELLLPSGLHEYLFVVDGHWLRDPNNPRRVPNPFGGENSIVEVRPVSTRAARSTVSRSL